MTRPTGLILNKGSSSMIMCLLRKPHWCAGIQCSSIGSFSLSNTFSNIFDIIRSLHVLFEGFSFSDTVMTPITFQIVGTISWSHWKKLSTWRFLPAVVVLISYHCSSPNMKLSLSSLSLHLFWFISHFFGSVEISLALLPLISRLCSTCISLGWKV